MAAAAKQQQQKDEERPAYEQASPTLLSMQPNEAPEKKNIRTAANPEWQALRSHSEARIIALRMWRASWWTQNWSDLAEFIEPRRSIWLTQSTGGIPTPNNMTRGRPINSQIVDPTGTLAVRVCAAGLMSGLASPSRPWFKVIPAVRNFEVDSAGREWLDEIESRLYTVLAGSNFYNGVAQEFEDLVVFGTGPNLIYEDAKDVIRCYNPAVGEYYLSTDATMRIDGLYRLFVMTVSQMVSFFTLEKCPPEVQKLWAQKGAALEIERIVAHGIEPNFAIGENGYGVVPGNFTWREVYWAWGAGAEGPLSLCGFVDTPFTCARWSIQSNDAYGRSVGMDVLPDIMQLQVETRRKAEGIEKQVRPPLIGDMSLKNQPSSTLPGHLTYVQNLGPGNGIRPIYEVNPDLNAITADIAAIQQRIKVGFFNDLFLMLEQMKAGQMTAYEVAQKMQEKLQVLGPVIESLLSDSLKPKLKRAFGIMKRRGMIPAPPKSLQGIPLDIQFVSMLALAQKAAATGGIERLLQLVGSMVAVFPAVKDNVDADTTVREFNELLGNPQKILFGPEQVAAQRQQAAAEAEQQQQMAQASQMAEAAGKAAPAAAVLSNTKLGAGQNALASALGGGSPQ